MPKTVAKCLILVNTVLMSGILPHDLNPKQLEAVTAPMGPLLITAGAGSGKTKTLTNRLAYLLDSGVAPESILAITFTNKAAAEMKERVARLLSNSAFSTRPPFIGTFHSFGAKILRTHPLELGRTHSFTIFDDGDSEKVLRDIYKKLSIDKIQNPLSQTKNKISKLKNELTDPDDSDDLIREIYNYYENSLREQNAFDFDDLITKVIVLFNQNPEILKKYHSELTHFLVDEYQDVNTSQYQLVKILASKYKNLNVVGDDHQSIYAFRGSDFRNFLNFERDYPEAKIITLDQNYRSTKTIVTAASTVISNNKFQRPKTLWTDNQDGELIKVLKFSSPEAEAGNIVSSLALEDFSKSAILYRTNAQSRPIEQALVLNRIPYVIFGGLKFYDRKEIKDLVAALRYALNPKDEVGKERFQKEFGKTKTKHIVNDLPEIAKKLSPVELIGFIMKETDYLTGLKKEFKNFEERSENISELISFAGNFSSLSEMIERISLLQSTDDPKRSTDRCVKLMTVHMAKGLEFDSVHLVGVNEGIMPHERSIFRPEDIEEERRLMYVAMTRAKKKLEISFFKIPSRFLYEMPPELVVFEDNNYFEDDSDNLSTIYFD